MLTFGQTIILITLIYIFVYTETNRICKCLEQRKLMENFNEYLKVKGYVDTDDILEGIDLNGSKR